MLQGWLSTRLAFSLLPAIPDPEQPKRSRSTRPHTIHNLPILAHTLIILLDILNRDGKFASYNRIIVLHALTLILYLG